MAIYQRGRRARAYLAALALLATAPLAGLATSAAAQASPAAPSCAGTAYTWTGNGNSNSWSNTMNWDPAGVPGQCSSDSVTISQEANITGVPAVQLADLIVTADAGSDGTLVGGPISVSGNFEWDGSTFDATINMLAGSTGDVGGAGNFKGLGGGGLGEPGRLNIAGSLTLDDLSGVGGSLGLGAGIGQGVIDVQAKGLLTSTGKDNISGASCCAGSDNPTLINDGKVSVTSGTLMTSGLETSSDGRLVAGAGALFDVDSPVELGKNSSYSGAGRMLLDLGAFPSGIKGTITLGKGFTLELGPQACLDGTGTISGAGTFDFSGGYLPADLTVAKGALMEVTGSGVKDLSTFACGTSVGNIVDDGRVVVEAGTLTLGGTGTLTTKRGGELSIAPGATITSGKRLSNAGTLDLAARPSGVKPGTAATVSLVTLTNTGTIVAGAGQTLVLSGVAVSNAGTVTAARGRIEVTGSYAQLRGGTLAVTIAGTSAGKSLGQLVVDGPATLAGTLRLSLGRGFSPRRGASFEVLSYQARKGKFTRLSGHPSYQIRYRRTSADATYR
jgi:fibronectin-binding autotransporter adhesin